MLIKRNLVLPYSSVTPRGVSLSRRRFLAGGGAAAMLGFGTGVSVAGTKLSAAKSPLSTTEKPTPFQDVSTYNNFYEFGTTKSDPSRNAKNLRTVPWTVCIEGAVAKPRVLDLDALLKIAPLEERIYRHRCVEGWSILVPWIGFSFSTLANLVEPTPQARFVSFESYYDPCPRPLGKYAVIQLPYLEVLRLDQAVHPLALLCAP